MVFTIAVVATTARSHLLPSLPLVRELAARGHRVTITIGDQLAGLAGATGARVAPHASVLPREGDTSTAWPQDPVAGMDLFLNEGMAVLPALYEQLRADPPQIVLHDMAALAGPVLAARLGVPAVQLSPTFVAWDGYEQDMAEPLAELRSSSAYRAHIGRFADWIRDHGIGRTPEEVLSRPEHGLVLIPQVLQPHADRVAASFRFVGPLIDPDRREPGSWSAPPGEGPLLYVAFGTAYTDQLAIYRAVVDGFAGSGWRVVLSLGRYVTADDLGVLPRGMAAHPWVPQPAVLEQAHVFVSHAGMGSTSEALWAGVPVVAVPQAVDQPANADRLVELGVGVHLPAERVSPGSLRAAVDSLASPAVGARAAAIRRQVRASGGPVAAAQAVEHLLT